MPSIITDSFVSQLEACFRKTCTPEQCILFNHYARSSFSIITDELNTRALAYLLNVQSVYGFDMIVEGYTYDLHAFIRITISERD